MDISHGKTCVPWDRMGFVLYRASHDIRLDPISQWMSHGKNRPCETPPNPLGVLFLARDGYLSFPFGGKSIFGSCTTVRKFGFVYQVYVRRCCDHERIEVRVKKVYISAIESRVNKGVKWRC